MTALPKRYPTPTHTAAPEECAQAPAIEAALPHARWAALAALVFCLLIAIAVIASSANPTPAEAAQSANTANLAAASSGTVQAAKAKAKATVKVRARVNSWGWLDTVKAGKFAGTKTSLGLRAFRVKLASLKNTSGHVKYRTYDTGLGWGKTVKDGKSSGRARYAVQAARIWLTGPVAKQFDVKYRLYIFGKGWTAWKTNKATAGSTKYDDYATGLQVKLVRKGSVKAKKTLDGVDIASWQEGINPAKIDADFVIVKATEGTWYKNPYFKKWADATLKSGKLLGAYHFVRTGNANKQADYFVKSVGPYIGKCALFLDWENRDGDNSMDQGPGWAKKFLDRVYKKTGVKPLIYTSKNVTRAYNWTKVARKYGLWVAQYLFKYYTYGSGYVKNPDTDDYGYGAWKAPTIYQYNSNGYISGYSKNIDINIFYGTVSDWKKMQSKS